MVEALVVEKTFGTLEILGKVCHEIRSAHMWIVPIIQDVVEQIWLVQREAKETQIAILLVHMRCAKCVVPKGEGIFALAEDDSPGIAKEEVDERRSDGT
jgi:hypothetical protein